MILPPLAFKIRSRKGLSREDCSPCSEQGCVSRFASQAGAQGLGTWGPGDLRVELPGWATGPRALGGGVSRAGSSPNACVDPHGVPNACAVLGRGLPKNERPPEWAEAAGTNEPRFSSGSWQVAGRPGTQTGLVSS